MDAQPALQDLVAAIQQELDDDNGDDFDVQAEQVIELISNYCNKFFWHVTGAVISNVGVVRDRDRGITISD